MIYNLRPKTGEPIFSLLLLSAVCFYLLQLVNSIVSFIFRSSSIEIFIASAIFCSGNKSCSRSALTIIFLSSHLPRSIPSFIPASLPASIPFLNPRCLHSSSNLAIAVHIFTHSSLFVCSCSASDPEINAIRIASSAGIGLS